MEDEKILEQIRKAEKTVESFVEKLGTKMDKAEFQAVKETLDKLGAEFKTMSDEKLGDSVKVVKDGFLKFQEQFEEMQESINLMKDSANARASAIKSFGQAAIDALEASGKLKDFQYRKGNHANAEFKVSHRQVLKNPAAMGTANVLPTTGGGLIYELTQFEQGLTNIQSRRPWILDLANVSPISAMYAGYAEKKNRDGTAGATAQGSAKNQIDFDWQEVTKKVEKYTAYIKASKESLADLPGLRNEIDNELREMLMLAVDADLLAGTGVTPHIAGILTGDTAFNPSASFTGVNGVINAGKSDVLRAAIAQVVAANFIPNYILLHPDDVGRMDLEKDTLGAYVMPPFKSQDGRIISGVRVVENTGQTLDNFTVGDFTKLNVRLREDFMIDVGLDGSDFTLNLITVLAEMRLVSYIKSNHQAAFVSGDFTTGIPLIAA